MCGSSLVRPFAARSYKYYDCDGSNVTDPSPHDRLARRAAALGGDGDGRVGGHAFAKEAALRQLWQRARLLRLRSPGGAGRAAGHSNHVRGGQCQRVRLRTTLGGTSGPEARAW